MTIAKHLRSCESESDPDCSRLNLHLLKSVTVYNAIELWSLLNEFEIYPASLCGCQNDYCRRFQLYLSVINVQSAISFLHGEHAHPFSLSTAEEASDPKRVYHVGDVTAALKRLSVIHKIACIATNHMYAEMSCSCLPTHRSFSAQCVILQIFALYSGLVFGQHACATSLVLVPLNVELGHLLLSVKKSSVHPAGASVMLRIEERGVVRILCRHALISFSQRHEMD